MEKRTLTCINCPLGCQIEVTLDSGAVQSITGNTCKRGAQYAEKEVTHPTRIVTTSVAVTGSKTGAHTVPAPVRIGDVLLPDAAGTGVPIIATKPVD